MNADRTTDTPFYPQCCKCGEYLGLDHDVARCVIIYDALANYYMIGRVPTEGQRNIVELTRWLADHPYASTPQARQAKTDREVSLDRWIRLAQQGGAS